MRRICHRAFAVDLIGEPPLTLALCPHGGEGNYWGSSGIVVTPLPIVIVGGGGG